MKWLLGACICSTLVLQAVPKSPNGKQPAFDADLYRKNEQVWSAHAEFLFWRVQEGSLDYALRMKQPVGGPPYYAQGTVKKATFNGDPGFRVAASFFRAEHFWDVKGQYTRLTATGSNSTGKPDASTQYLTGTWPQITTNPLSGARSDIHMNYNVFDLWVDRVFNPNPHLRMRIIGGGSTAWINQDWKVRYYDSTGISTSIRNRWSYAGGGLLFGAMFDWYWGLNVYMTALGKMGTYIGAYHNRASQKSGFPGSNPDVPVLNTDFHDCRPAFTIQGYLGPSWQKNFPRNRVEVFLGYEVNTWFNLQEVYQSTAATGAYTGGQTWIDTGLIALQGLTTRVTVDF